jgi:hypothetical protein
MKTYISIISLGIALAASQATFAADKGQIVPRKDLPANLKGGKVAKNNDGIPGCTTGRVAMSLKDLGDWAETHAKHDCASASTVLVCRVGKNLSVRCE